MDEPDILFQAYAPEALNTRYFPRGGEMTMELRHGDAWPADVGRADPYDRIELSIKPMKEKTKWRYASTVFEYEVAAPWEERRCGKGHIILGQIHCHRPLFSLRWAPSKADCKERLWMDFMTDNENESDPPFYIGNLLGGFATGDFLRIKIETFVEADGIEFKVRASVPDSDLCETESRKCHPDEVRAKEGEPMRFKIGAYRKRKDQKDWPPMVFTYRGVKIGGEVIDGGFLISPRYNSGL